MNRYWYCGIQVKGMETVYSYISDTGEIKSGSYVMVPFGNQNALRIGIVKFCSEYTAEEAPYPVEWTKHIVREATAEEYENQPPLPPYYRNDDIQDDLDEVNYSIGIEDWEEVYEWAYCHDDDSNERIARKAVECYELCIEHDMPEAALDLGELYDTGKVVEQNHQKAYELYQIAADAGLISAIRNCGYGPYYGQHQDIDYKKAYQYFSLGALLHDDANCLYKLGDMYLNGYGVDQNEDYAFMLYQRALGCCQKNDRDSVFIADAQFRVGKCYLDGIGTYKNTEKAHELLSLALVNFYKRRKRDHFVIELIRSTKELLVQAQTDLDKETSDYQRKWDCELDDLQF
ncbi:tetratricopeptide repeat protein [Massiliimalia massiliensis]|uniref:tetratricopeptide repeat protein n=1 Tax=Massiliimalia massiliensis TaxID=1852384 RepID=UPI0009877C6C|nr:tetratricopeptide repeat protein [Massiliimalia massiliensis]